MDSFVGVIRSGSSAANAGNDDLYFQRVVQKFPSAFANAQKVATPHINILGGYTLSALVGNAQVAINGSIFNRQELITLAGTVPAYASDADLVLNLIFKEGINAVEKINGQCSIIYYDAAQRKISFISDHLGVQQVLYYHNDGVFIFGSEVKYLQQHPDCPKGIDWKAALKRPLSGVVLGSYKNYDTWFQGIKLMPEASIMELDLNTGSATMRRYWQPYKGDAANDNRTTEQVMDEYMALLDDAVRIRMAPHGKTHSLLSGGLDSSVICALAARHAPIDTFSIINQTTVLEDTTYFCHQLSSDLGFENAQFLVPYHRLGFDHDLWKQRVWRAESPVNHTDSLTKTMLHYAISKTDPQVRNVLSGTGSDQMNGGLVGYIAPAADTMEESWVNFYNEILDVEHSKLIERGDSSLWRLRGFVNRDFVASMAGQSTEPNPWMIYLDGAVHSQAYSLVWDEQRASAAHGHTTSYPFMDYRLAEFIAAIPQHLQKDLFYDKRILREPAKKVLPGYIVNKAKMPYNLPEYDTRVQSYEYLTADNELSLFLQAFGDIEIPHPAINKKQLYARICAMRQKPDIMEWISIMHIINLGLLDQLAEQDEASVNYEAALGVPEQIHFHNIPATQTYLRQQLAILSKDDLIDKPVKFGENCSLLVDTKSNKYYLSKRNNLTYEIDDEYATWRQFLIKIDSKLTTREILKDMDLAYEAIEEFFNLSLKEQILVITDKRTGY